MTPAREVLIAYSYVFGFSRRKGWYLKPTFERVLAFDCDAAFRLRRISIGFHTGHKSQIRQFCRAYRLAVDGLQTGLPIAAFGDVASGHCAMPCEAEFKPGSTVRVSFSGEPFSKMRKTLRWSVMFSGEKVFQLSETGIGPWERAQ